MPVKVEVKMDVPSMTEFMVYHIYSSGIGIASMVLGVLNVGLTVTFAMKKQYLYMALFFAFAFIILGIFPGLIRKRVAKQMEHSRRLNIPVTYAFDEYGIETTTPDDSGKASWGKFKKAVSRKGIIILYDHAKQTIILPVNQIEQEYTDIVDLIYAHMPAPAVRIRRADGKK